MGATWAPLAPARWQPVSCAGLTLLVSVQVSQVSPQGVSGMLQASLARQGSALGGVAATPDSNGASPVEALLPSELFRGIR